MLSASVFQRLYYIHQNPVKEGIVRFPEEYLYSSAGNYAGRSDNVVEVMVI